FQTSKGANGSQHMGRVGALLASCFEPASCSQLLQHDLEGALLGSMGKPPAAKFAQDREVKARIGQIQAERILDINPRANRISSLSVSESFGVLDHRHQPQTPRCFGSLSS